MLRHFVDGTVEVPRSRQPGLDSAIASTAATQTKRPTSGKTSSPHPNLQELMQDFYEGIILSIFSKLQFLDVV